MFWRLTPREWGHEIAAAQLRWQDERERDLGLAWHTASFVLEGYVGKLPDLRTVIERTRVVRTMTPAAQRSQVAMLSERLGVPLVPISDAAKAALVRLRMKES